MPKNKLFDEDSEEEVAIKTENEYAKRYDAWREKEEKYKCKMFTTLILTFYHLKNCFF